jgi:hypothetical protein
MKNFSKFVPYLCREFISKAAIALICIFVAPQAVFAGDAGAVGGTGGGEFRISCEPGDTLVGIDAMATHVIDFIAPVCGNRQKDSLATYGRPSAGALAGTLYKPRCPPDAVLTILHVFADKTPLVARVGFTCWNIKTQEMTNSFADFGGDTAVTDQRLICPPGQVGTGIYGRAGTAIDRLGLICSDWQVAATEPEQVDAAPPPVDDGNLKTATVAQEVEVYNQPGGNGQKTGDLGTGTKVSVLGDCVDSWCHVTGPRVPNGDGYVYNGDDYRSLKF